VIWQHPSLKSVGKKGLRCCKNATKIYCIPRPPSENIILPTDPRAKKNPHLPGANRIYGWGSRTLAVWTWVLLLQTACRERIVGLSYCLQLQLLGLYAVAVHAVTLAATTHTCNLCYCLPLVWEADTQVCDL